MTRWTETQLDLICDLYRRICVVASRYTFVRPVEPADLDTVRRDLAAALPGYPVTLALDGHVQVKVCWPDGVPLYRRQMLVI